LALITTKGLLGTGFGQPMAQWHANVATLKANWTQIFFSMLF